MIPCSVHEQILREQDLCHGATMRDLEASYKKQLAVQEESLRQLWKAKEGVLRQQLQLAEQDGAELREAERAAETCESLEVRVREAGVRLAELREFAAVAEAE
eukprot:CAMPEP_0203891104 /NCGR_PEP_ID=MMETSP0359-20131031/34444_1 /ASSEMBLY_ACC=CAM_ASM_000338 /TAXON_ID=268821 /ORGANISM="Scrippsiella Hangoei, Strain SHTV-5" /LENGTH=102 /DNA_ID=CAMNT_0050812833 /DNA_START=20 /DNA_END=325 /DNA_ORIENTATION=+